MPEFDCLQMTADTETQQGGSHFAVLAGDDTSQSVVQPLNKPFVLFGEIKSRAANPGGFATLGFCLLYVPV